MRQVGLGICKIMSNESSAPLTMTTERTVSETRRRRVIVPTAVQSLGVTLFCNGAMLVEYANGDGLSSCTAALGNRWRWHCTMASAMKAKLNLSLGDNSLSVYAQAQTWRHADCSGTDRHRTGHESTDRLHGSGYSQCSVPVQGMSVQKSVECNAMPFGGMPANAKRQKQVYWNVFGHTE